MFGVYKKIRAIALYRQIQDMASNDTHDGTVDQFKKVTT